MDGEVIGWCPLFLTNKFTHEWTQTTHTHKRTHTRTLAITYRSIHSILLHKNAICLVSTCLRLTFFLRWVLFVPLAAEKNNNKRATTINRTQQTKWNAEKIRVTRNLCIYNTRGLSLSFSYCFYSEPLLPYILDTRRFVVYCSLHIFVYSICIWQCVKFSVIAVVAIKNRFILASTAIILMSWWLTVTTWS